MSDPQPSFLAAPSMPKLRLPAGACDAHVHVFGPHRIFPYAPDAPYAPADAPKEKLFAMSAQRKALLVDNPQRFYKFPRKFAGT